jgi:mono/diheme cytochrome c family protein
VRAPLGVTLATAIALAAGVAPASADGADGATLYGRYCLACHGTAGDGLGPAAPFVWPPPRDFTRGDFKWRSTRLADPPTRDDLAAAIRFGAPGTSMPAFDGILDDAQLDAVIAVVRGFARPTAAPAPGKAPPAPPSPLPAVSDASIARGKAAFTDLGCATCHGDGGRGDGPGAAALKPEPPYDLTAVPLRRPRPSDAPDDVRVAIWRSVTTGLAGTPMPALARGTDPETAWALVDYVDSLRATRSGGARATAVPARAIAADRMAAATWTGGGAPAEAAIWGAPIPLQGDPPAALAPAQASLSSQQCARCHAKQAREWRGTLHAHAVSPGFDAQTIRPTHDAPTWADVASCQQCHAPLAEQLAMTRGSETAANPAYDADLRAEGITCAGCHVRGWTRNGPPRVATSLVPSESYPLVELELYERSDFCMPCHQLPARTAVAGKPLLDTYREWLDGPYMPRGIQCQHCHMPNREHTWKGVHDPDTFRQGIDVTATAERAADRVRIHATLTNVGAGHMLPTTPTPAAWLRVRLLDAAGKVVPRSEGSKRIGRHIKYTAKGWRELEDTRVAPGASIDLIMQFKQTQVRDATQLEVVVDVHPDDYYEGFYAEHLEGKLADDLRALYEAAAARAAASHYEALRLRVPIR